MNIMLPAGADACFLFDCVLVLEGGLTTLDLMVLALQGDF